MTKRTGFFVALVALGVIGIALSTLTTRAHGHQYEPLDVTVRIVDATTGRPLAGAVVATLRFRSTLQLLGFEEYLANAADGRQDGPVHGTRTTEAAVTRFTSELCITRYWVNEIQTEERADVPRLLLIEHPRFTRALIPIEATAVEGPDGWSIDLGEVRIPR